MNIDIPAKTKVKATIYGRSFDLSKPTVSQIEKLQASMKGVDEKDSVGIMKKWTADLGLPIDFADTMEVDHFLQVVETICGTKKK